jgi:hypothetical protein
VSDGSSQAGETIQTEWARFCDELKQIGPVLGRASTPDDELTVAEGVRHLSRLIRIGLEANVETLGADTPALMQLVSETKKFGCDNPNTMYISAVIDGARQYRVTGPRGSVDYISLTTQELVDGRYTQTGFLDTSQLTVNDAGEVDVILSVEPVAGNWLPMSPASSRLSIRQTFLDRAAEQPATLRLDRVDGAATPAPLTVADIRARLHAAVGWADYAARTFTDWTEGYQAHPNQLPPADQEKCLAAGGDPNIYFYRSYWSLEPDQALIVHIPRIPECDTWNLQVDNYWQESMDYRFVRSWLNKHTAVANDDGSVTAVIAWVDPGYPNWLSTAGHRLGHFAMRWIRAQEHIDPVTRVCALSEVGTAIGQLRAATRPVQTGEQAG